MTDRIHRVVGTALTLLIVGALLVASAGVADAGQDPIGIDRVDTSNYPTVELTVTAPPAFLGIDVPTSDWRLLEADAGRAITTKGLKQEAISVVLVIDTSGSMAGQPLISAKSAALEFLDRLPEGTSAAVIGFGDIPEVRTAFTTDRNAVAIAVDNLTATGETALYDAVQTSVALLDDAPGDRTGIVLLTDGADTVSSTELATATLSLTEADTNFSAIELRTNDSDRSALQFFAAATSGQILAAEDPGSLTTLYSQIADGLANQYQITYQSVTDEVTTDLRVIIDSDRAEAVGQAEVILPPLASRPAPDTNGPVDPANDVAAVPVSAIAQEPGPLGRSWVIWAGAAMLFAALALGGAILFAPRLTMRSLSSDAEVQESTEFDLLHDVGERAGAFSGRVLDRTGVLPTLDTTLEQAGFEVRPGEFVAIVGAIAVFGGAIGAIFGGVIFGLIMLALPLVLAPAVLSIRRTRRQMRFADQLADTLLLFSSTLRAGYGLPQAIDTVANESPEPTATEFGRVVLESRLGRPVDDSLERLGQRMNNIDFGWVVDAVRIQRDIGGNLAEVLDHIEGTIRARARIRRQVRALTAEGRLSAIVLLALPFAIGLIIFVTNREYITPLFTDTAGQIMLGAGLTLILIGALWLRKLVEPEF